LPGPRIVLADDHEFVRRGVRSMLEAEPGWKVVGEVADGHDAVAMVKELKPDILVLDIGMPRLNGLDAARRIRKVSPNTKILILSMHDSENLAKAVVHAGALGYVTKSDTARDLVLAINALLRGKIFFTPSVDRIMLDCFLHDGKQPRTKDDHEGQLTSRQREIVQLLAEGKSSKEVSSALGLSVKTVETHRANIMRRLGYHSISDLVRYAVRNAIIQA
jgi:DNA-binding NarL/FixJ family response regulator